MDNKESRSDEEFESPEEEEVDPRIQVLVPLISCASDVHDMCHLKFIHSFKSHFIALRLLSLYINLCCD